MSLWYLRDRDQMSVGDLINSQLDGESIDWLAPWIRFRLKLIQSFSNFGTGLDFRSFMSAFIQSFNKNYLYSALRENYSETLNTEPRWEKQFRFQVGLHVHVEFL